MDDVTKLVVQVDEALATDDLLVVARSIGVVQDVVRSIKDLVHRENYIATPLVIAQLHLAIYRVDPIYYVDDSDSVRHTGWLMRHEVVVYYTDVMPSNNPLALDVIIPLDLLVTKGNFKLVVSEQVQVN